MSHPELKVLTRAEQFFDAGKLDKALELLNDWTQFVGLSFQQKTYFQFLKGLILIYQNKHEALIKLGDQIFKEGQNLNDNLQKLDGFFFILMGLGLANKFDEAFKKIDRAEALLRLISNTSKISLIQREVRIKVLKGWINFLSGNVELAEKCLEWALGSQNVLVNTFETVWVNLLMAHIMIQVKNRFDLAMKYTKKAMLLAKEIKFNHYWIGYCHVAFGVINQSISEYDNCLKHYKKSLAIFKEINNNWYIANVLNNIGNLYCDKGEYDLALKYLEDGLLLWEQYPLRIEACLDSLIFVALEKGDTERAQKYFHRLENMHNQKKDSLVELLYQYNKALILKRSSRIRDKAKAEKLLKQIIETEPVFFDLTINAYIHLCDLLLAEFRINNDNKVLEEINQFNAQLLTIAEKSGSYLIFCETYLLQAKLALINFNVKAARRFLTQAQKIAESHGIKRLAIKISYEHDKLIKQLKMWKNLENSEASLSERWKLAGLNEQMDNMVKKRMIEVPELSDEESVLLLIVSEGGMPFFSHSFLKDKSFKDHLFGGFLTTIDYFIREMFSEGLDRATFGEYTLLMKSIPPFFISYIYKGDSYYALQRINYFINHIQKKEDIWQNLLKSFQLNQSIHLKDIPLLESLITETFITKSMVFSEF